jgi:hypothetical protein
MWNEADARFASISCVNEEIAVSLQAQSGLLGKMLRSMRARRPRR